MGGGDERRALLFNWPGRRLFTQRINGDGREEEVGVFGTLGLARGDGGGGSLRSVCGVARREEGKEGREGRGHSCRMTVT